MTGTIASYGSIYNLGHRALADLFGGPVVVQEKVDGSQFSFGVYGGELVCRSKGQVLVPDAPEKMFAAAVEQAERVKGLLPDGRTFRAEYLQKPKHNTLAYDRTPANHLILFDIDRGQQDYLPPDDVAEWAAALGFEAVPTIHNGLIENPDAIRDLLTTTSVLGGQTIEGVVIKNYARFGPDKKVLMGKFVSEAFKERNAKEWKQSNPGGKDIVEQLIEELRTEARWAKAVQHLREQGRIEGTPRDIGVLMKEAGQDIAAECREDIAAALWKWAWPKIQRGATRGLAEWYKQQLLEEQFADA